MPGMHGVPAPLRSGIDIHLERDIAAVHRTMGPSPAGSRPTPLYMKESKFSVPARKRSPAKTEFLGPSQAMRSTLCRRIQWRYIVLDEGHRIKNERTSLYERLSQMPSARLWSSWKLST